MRDTNPVKRSYTTVGLYGVRRKTRHRARGLGVGTGRDCRSYATKAVITSPDATRLNKTVLLSRVASGDVITFTTRKSYSRKS